MSKKLIIIYTEVVQGGFVFLLCIFLKVTRKHATIFFSVEKSEVNWINHPGSGADCSQTAAPVDPSRAS